MKDKNVVLDAETHRKLRILAAVRQVSIKDALKDLIEKAHKDEVQEKNNE